MVEHDSNVDKVMSSKIYKEWDSQEVSDWLKDSLKLA